MKQTRDCRSQDPAGAPAQAAKGPFAPVDAAIAAIRRGEMVIVVDDEDRENEGDLTIAAEKVTPDAINFMMTHGRGLICMPMTGARLDELADSLAGPATTELDAVRHGVLRRHRGQEGHHHRHLRGRSRANGPDGDQRRTKADGPGAARATCFRCAPATAACWCGPGRPRRPSISRASPDSTRPA